MYQKYYVTGTGEVQQLPLRANQQRHRPEVAMETRRRRLPHVRPSDEKRGPRNGSTKWNVSSENEICYRQGGFLTLSLKTYF